MKKAPFLSLLTIFSLGSITNTFANENRFSEMQQNMLARPTRIYFGPEILLFQVDTHVHNIHIDDQEFFWGLKLGYEYLKPQAFYAAAEMLVTNTNQNFSFSQDSLVYNGQRSSGFGNIQTRFGYTLSRSHQLITPFLGLGVYALSKHHHNGFQEVMGYLSGGVRTQFECTSAVLIGVNAEIFRTLGVKQSVTIENEKFTKHTNDWGCNIGVPLTIRLSRGWDMQLTPYFLRLLFSESQNIYGTTLLFGYRF